MTLKEIADYASQQADRSHVRLINSNDGGVLYDDTYWQGVLDIIRFELYQVIAEDSSAQKI